MTRNKYLAPIIVFAMLIFSALAYPALPDEVPMHWDFNGNPDRTAPKLYGVLFLPVLTAIMLPVFYTFRRIDPLRESYVAFEGAYRFYINLAVFFLGYMHVIMLGVSLGWNISLPHMVVFAMGIMLVLTGNILGLIRPNWFVGYRTPWTLSDANVWRLTHRMGGRLMVTNGVLTIGLSLLLPITTVIVIAVACMVTSSLITMGYSYVIWRRLNLVPVEKGK